jgi:hypothetical protein
MNNIYMVTEPNGFSHEIVAQQEFVDQYYPGKWVFVRPEFEPETVVAYPPITKLAMIDRFSDAEYTGILTAAKTDVEVQGWLDRFYAVSSVNLKDQRTIAGINMMVSKGLLTQARGESILNDPVQPEEFWSRS